MNSREKEMKKEILGKIEKEMVAIGMSQGELGRQVDVARHHINSYLRGKNLSLSFERIFEMANVVGLEVKIDVRRKRKNR